MTPFLRKLLGLNWLLLVNMLALAIFGVVAIYSDLHARRFRCGRFLAQAGELGRSRFFAFMVTSLIDYRWIRWARCRCISLVFSF
jgi:cell division protein FtsW (lipid II flippase)